MTLITDNALCFTSEEFGEFAKSWNFTHITSSLRYPKGNTHAEKGMWVWLSKFTIAVKIHCMGC